MAPFNDRYEDDIKYHEMDNTLNSSQLAALDEYFSRKLSEESSSENVNRNIQYPNEKIWTIRDKK